MNKGVHAFQTPFALAKERLTIPALWHLLNLPGQPKKSCRSPFRDDRTASFSIYDDGRRFHDFATGERGDAVDFLSLALDLSKGDAIRRLIEMAGLLPAPPIRRYPAKTDIDDSAERAQKRERWPRFEYGTEAELAAVAKLRGLSMEGLIAASEHGLLWFADSTEGRAWIVTDSQRRCAQARRLDGEPWKKLGGVKARTLPGSEAALPLGWREATHFGHIVLCEGGPDLLAAFHLTHQHNCVHTVAPIAMLGASQQIHADALPVFKGKHVRLFMHNDEAGAAAAARWMIQLRNAGAKHIDGFKFQGLTREDGQPVNDLNDFIHTCKEDHARYSVRIRSALQF